MTRLLAPFFLAAALAAPASAQAQDNVLTVNPIDLVNGFVDVEFEHAWNPIASFHVGVDFLVWDGVWDEHDGDTWAVGPQFGMRFYPLASAPALLWMGPFGGVAFVHSSAQDVTGEAVGGWVGGMIGVNGILFDILAISGGLGLAYHDLSVNVDGREHGLQGWWPRARLGLGVAF
jgi:hypothetical protein